MNVLPVIPLTVGLWPFQGDLTDISGNGLDFSRQSGAELGRFVSVTPGSSFLMMEQDYNNTPVLQTPASALLAIAGPITIEWLFVQNDAAEDYFFYAEEGAVHPFGAHFVGGRLNWFQSSNTPFAAGATDPVNTLHFGALVRDGANNVKYYQDGVLFGTVAVGAATAGSTPRLFCGYLARGKIATLRIVSRALSASEVAADSAYVYSDAPTPPAPEAGEGPNAIGSMPSGISLLTGDDSVLTGAGVCPTAPPLLVKDAASMLTGFESILTAGNPTDCGSTIVSRPPDGFIWYRGDSNDAAYMTVDGSNRISRLINQFPPDIDVTAVNSFGVALPNTQWPTWAANELNGLGGVTLDGSKSQFLNKIYPVGTLNMPTADGEPLRVLAVVRPNGLQSGGARGTLLTMRMTNDDFECCLRVASIFLFGEVQIPVSSAQNSKAQYIGTGSGPFPLGTALVTDYSDQNLLMDWTYRGVGSNPTAVARHNGEGFPLFDFSPTAVFPYTGVSGMSFGYCNAVDSCFWNGKFFELLVYKGADALDPDIGNEAWEYLNQKWGLELLSHPFT